MKIQLKTLLSEGICGGGKPTVESEKNAGPRNIMHMLDEMESGYERGLSVRRWWNSL